MQQGVDDHYGDDTGERGGDTPLVPIIIIARSAEIERFVVCGRAAHSPHRAPVVSRQTLKGDFPGGKWGALTRTFVGLRDTRCSALNLARELGARAVL